MIETLVNILPYPFLIKCFAYYEYKTFTIVSVK